MLFATTLLVAVTALLKDAQGNPIQVSRDDLSWYTSPGKAVGFSFDDNRSIIVENQGKLYRIPPRIIEEHGWIESDEDLWDDVGPLQRHVLNIIVIPELHAIIKKIKRPDIRRIHAYEALHQWVNEQKSIRTAAKQIGVALSVLRSWLAGGAVTPLHVLKLQEKVGIPTWAWVQSWDPRLQFQDGAMPKPCIYPDMDSESYIVTVDEEIENKMIRTSSPERALRLWRYHNGLGVNDAAALMGVSVYRIYSAESSDMAITPQTVLTIAKHTWISPYSWEGVNWERIHGGRGSILPAAAGPGQKLRRYRLDQKYTIKQMAEKLKTVPSLISMFETGRRENPSVDTAIRIEKMTGIGIHEWKGLKDFIIPSGGAWKLWRWRAIKGWTRKELASKLDVSESNIAHWEYDGALPTAPAAFAIYQLTGITDFSVERESRIPHGKTGAELLFETRKFSWSTQEQMAERIGCSYFMYKQWEEGRAIPTDVWRLTLAEELNIPEDSWVIQPRTKEPRVVEGYDDEDYFEQPIFGGSNKRAVWQNFGAIRTPSLRPPVLPEDPLAMKNYISPKPLPPKTMAEQAARFFSTYPISSHSSDWFIVERDTVWFRTIPSGNDVEDIEQRARVTLSEWLGMDYVFVRETDPKSPLYLPTQRFGIRFVPKMAELAASPGLAGKLARIIW
jgi:transcriptional regulator with XRE-family HTH domain